MFAFHEYESVRRLTLKDSEIFVLLLPSWMLNSTSCGFWRSNSIVVLFSPKLCPTYLSLRHSRQIKRMYEIGIVTIYPSKHISINLSIYLKSEENLPIVVYIDNYIRREYFHRIVFYPFNKWKVLYEVHWQKCFL